MDRLDVGLNSYGRDGGRGRRRLGRLEALRLLPNRGDRETFELAEQIIVVTLVGIRFRQQTRASWILTQTRIDRFDGTRQGTGTIDRFDGQSVVAAIGPEILSTIVSRGNRGVGSGRSKRRKSHVQSRSEDYSKLFVLEILRKFRHAGFFFNKKGSQNLAT